MVFLWSLSDSKSPQVSRTLLSILAVINSVVVWVVSTRPLVFKYSSPFINPLVTVPKASITIGIIVTFISHSFFSILLQGPGTYLSFAFFQFYSMVSRNAKSTILQVLFRETWVQSQVESYQRLKKWYSMLPCLTLSIIKYKG